LESKQQHPEEENEEENQTFTDCVWVTHFEERIRLYPSTVILRDKCFSLDTFTPNTGKIHVQALAKTEDAGKSQP
jgi:hypothetical protein